MYLGYFRYCLPGPVGIRLIVFQRDPQVPQADQNSATVRIGDDVYHAFAFGCFNLGVYLKHCALRCNFQEADAIFLRAPNSGIIGIESTSAALRSFICANFQQASCYVAPKCCRREPTSVGGLALLRALADGDDSQCRECHWNENKHSEAKGKRDPIKKPIIVNTTMNTPFIRRGSLCASSNVTAKRRCKKLHNVAES